MSEQQPTQSTPRRRRPRRPKWVKNKFTYQLWRNWPLIRFALICILLLSIAFGMVKCTVGAVSGLFDRGDQPGESTPAASDPIETEPPETTEPEPDELMAQADAMAAGYDYDGAIALLNNSSYASRSDYQSRVAQYQSESQTLVKWEDMQNITHVFFHTLVVDNDRCFDGDYTEDGYNLYMTTIPEFLKMMDSMYQRGFVLVSPYDVAYEYTDENGNTRMKYGEIWLPEGKTPFVMSQDDVNYYGYMIGDVDPDYQRPAVPHADGDGFAHKIVIGEDGYPTCEYMDANGQIHVGDYDLVPILEKFIQEHPDFSYRGARAILGMTGYEGVFGYRTKPAYEDDLGTEAYQKECEQAKAVAQCLEEHGWILASHSYGHPSYGSITTEKMIADSDEWERTVQPIIGDCDIILYPNGSDVAGIEKYTFDNAKFAALYEDGYRYFYNVDSHYAWQQLGEDYFRGGRRNLDGYRMWHTPKKLADLFDVSEVFDPDRPTPVPSL
ncbi:MAG: polysaccharide deacetylase [Ruminococcaceae bacterium]|nr:polysaccharide deacetylase [Oscillospiraceae bacterium]